MYPEIKPKTKIVIYYLSYGGLFPFIFCLIGIYFGNHSISSYSMSAFVSYGAVILGFVGAVHWGFLLVCDDVKKQGLWLSLSVLPGLTGWLALNSTLKAALFMMMTAYPLLFLYERLSELNHLLPDWYRIMRLRLTVIVTSFMVLGLIFVI